MPFRQVLGLELLDWIGEIGVWIQGAQSTFFNG